VVSEELYGPFSSKQISETELEGPDPTHVDWCRRVLQESENLPEDDLEHCEVLENVAPLMYAQLIEDAETDEETVGGYLELLDGGLFEYVQDLIIYCRDEFEKTKQAPAIKQLETWVRAERSIPRGNLQEKLMRYQIGLDNELYKALRALRDAQKWRREAMEVQVNASKGADEQQLAV
jgi:hypothetical protein